MLAKTHHTQMPLDKREEQHNMVQFGTDLQKSSDTAPSAQAGKPSIGCPSSFWKSPRRRLHSLSGHVVPMLSHPHSKEVLPGIQKALPVFLTLGTTEKSMSPYSLFSPFRYLQTLIRSLLILPFSMQNSHGTVCLSS